MEVEGRGGEAVCVASGGDRPKIERASAGAVGCRRASGRALAAGVPAAVLVVAVLAAFDDGEEALVAVGGVLLVVLVLVVVAVVDEDKVVSAEDGARWERLFLPLGIGLPSAAQC